MDSTIKTRQHVVKEVLPQLAYLISDVVVFIDTVEARRTERVDRIRHFATMAHTSVESMTWKPALFLLQNKWVRGEDEKAVFDITSEYGWLVNDLQDLFSRVTVFRIPAASDSHNFEDSLHALHGALQASLQAVHSQREKVGSMHSEREFWFAFRLMVMQLNQRGVGKKPQMLQCLSEVASSDRASRSPIDNALRLLKMFGDLPSDGATVPLRRMPSASSWFSIGMHTQLPARLAMRAIQNALAQTCAERMTASWRFVQHRSHASQNISMKARSSLARSDVLGTVNCIRIRQLE
jgi:hypothetical protein